MTAVLVAYASRMGSTAEIAEAVGATLREAGLTVTVCRCDEVGTLDGYDAVLLGSAMYVRHWEREAVEFLERFGAQLTSRPTWLFQSGPCGEDAATQEVSTPRKVHRLVQRFDLRPPVTFGGRLDPAAAKDRLSRWVATGSMEGDFRDWDAIRVWARGCAHAIVSASEGVRSDLRPPDGGPRWPSPSPSS